MTTEVKVPTLGESITEATLGQWLKKPGDAVKADDAIASLETDKVAVDVPSPVAGVLGQQLVKEGDTVKTTGRVVSCPVMSFQKNAPYFSWKPAARIFSRTPSFSKIGRQ